VRELIPLMQEQGTEAEAPLSTTEMERHQQRG